MIRITLSATDRTAVQALRRDPSVRPAERDRVEMVVLSAVGWSPPRIAAHLSYHPATVRAVLKGFRTAGPASLRRGHPGPPPNAARRQQVEAALAVLLDQDRTWTAAQLAAALTDQGIRLSARQTRKYLARMRAGWRRTVRTVRQRHDPVAATAARTKLDHLKKSYFRSARADVSR